MERRQYSEPSVSPRNGAGRPGGLGKQEQGLKAYNFLEDFVFQRSISVSTRRTFTLLFITLLLLPAGCIVAHLVWYCLHHRYDSPETGLYHGYASVMFDGLDEPPYWMQFHAESSPRWYWRQPTNFSYTTLEVDWRDESSDRRATVSLPALKYHSDGASGAFTRDVLAGWLYGASINQISNRQHVDAIFDYFKAAADGSLPRPRHHTYYQDQPIRARVQHFLVGYGVGSTVYILVGRLVALVCVGCPQNIA